MNILFVESYPQVIAGQQRTLLSLLACCRERGWDATVMVPGNGPYVDELERQQFSVIVAAYPERLRRYGGAIYRDSRLQKLRTQLSTLGYIVGLRKRLKALRPDAIYCNDMRGLLTVGVAAKSLGIPCMTWDKLDKPHGILDWFQLPLVKINAIISQPVQTKYPRWQRWWYRNRIQKISNGVDFKKFQWKAGAVVAGTENSLRQQLKLDEDAVLIGIVGTVTPRKGHDLLLRSFDRWKDRMPSAHLVVIGDWDNSPADQVFYDSLQTQLGTADAARVHFLGNRDDVVALMNQIDILAIPSRHEGMGQVTVEAMACGKPVVGSRVGGIPEVVVDNETGFLFDLESTQQLTDALMKLLTSASLRQKMGAAGRQRAFEHFDRNEKMESICDLLETIAAAR